MPQLQVVLQLLYRPPARVIPYLDLEKTNFMKSAEFNFKKRFSAKFVKFSAKVGQMAVIDQMSFKLGNSF